MGTSRPAERTSRHQSPYWFRLRRDTQHRMCSGCGDLSDMTLTQQCAVRSAIYSICTAANVSEQLRDFCCRSGRCFRGLRKTTRQSTTTLTSRGNRSHKCRAAAAAAAEGDPAVMLSCGVYRRGRIDQRWRQQID